MQKNLQATKTHCLAAVFVDHYWQLPIWSVDLFTNTLRNLDQYCDLDFTRHYIYVKDDRLMRVDFNCNIEKCQLHGTYELFSDMKMKVNLKSVSDKAC